MPVNQAQLIDKLRSSIAPILEPFLEQPSEAAVKNEAELAKIEQSKKELAEQLGEDSKAFKLAIAGLTEAAAGLTISKSDQLKTNRTAAAHALIAACNEFRLPLQLKKQATEQMTRREAAPVVGDDEPVRNGAPRHRSSAEEIEAAMERVYKALPRSTQSYTTASEIAAEAEVDNVGYLLRKLRDEERAESNGMRGRACGWRRA